MKAIEQRVADGAAWLDEKYPGWFDKIDLAILDLGSCTQCVLGQVYTGVIPEREKGQVLAQVIRNLGELTDLDGEELEIWRHEYQNNLYDGVFGGYNVVVDFHMLDNGGEDHGFVCATSPTSVPDEQVDATEEAEYAALLEEWTRVIVSRRLAAHKAELVAA